MGSTQFSLFLISQIHNKECRNRYYGLGSKGAKAVAVALCSNDDIVQLDLADNGIGPMGAKYIAQVSLHYVLNPNL